MATLLTWSDRGSARRAGHRGPLSPGDRGPVLRFAAAPEQRDRYDHAIVLSLQSGRYLASQLVDELREYIRDVEIRLVDLADPSDYEAVFAQTKAITADLQRRSEEDLSILLSAGTPQMQAIWMVLVQGGFLGAQLFQVIPPAFVPDPHPQATRPVHFDFAGFPEILALKEEIAALQQNRPAPIEGLVGESEAMAALRTRIHRVASSELSLLIGGETGSGKELVARAVHDLSDRAKGPFVAENCGALSESVLESELFGHQRGAFTGAHTERAGLFERADGGTLLLDEVGELTPRMQSALLRVLQEGRLRRVGGNREICVDVRVLAASHRDLRTMVQAGTFREDLYYRLAGVRLEVPPLRARIEDLPPLVAHFQKPGAPALTGAALRTLARYPWPGNVRQLRSEVRRWQVFCDEVVRPEDLSEEVRSASLAPYGLDPSPGRVSIPSPRVSSPHVSSPGLTAPGASIPVLSAPGLPGTSIFAPAIDSVADSTDASSWSPRETPMRSGFFDAASETNGTQPLATLEEAVDETERRHIHAALVIYAGNLSQTARALGTDRNTLKRKLRRHDLYALVEELRTAAKASRVPAPTKKRPKRRRTGTE